jgi:hypothetical protein
LTQRLPTSANTCCDYLNAFPTRTTAHSWATAHPDFPGRIIDSTNAVDLGRTSFEDLLT